MLNTFIVVYHPNGKVSSLPENLGDKVKYMAAIAKDERLPDALRDKFRCWAEQLGGEMEHRHMLVHGLGQTRWNGDKFQWSYQTLRVGKKGPRLETKHFDHEDFSIRLKKMGELSHDIAVQLNPILFPQK